MAAAAAAASLETLTLPRARLHLAIASSPRSSLSIRGGELGLALAPLPQFTGLGVSRRLQKAPSAAWATNPKADRRSTVICEVQETATEVPDVTKETRQSRVMECARPIVIEFWAPWCGPCRMIHPVIARMLQDRHG